jgi:uncharacterized protein (DUF2237 family)
MREPMGAGAPRGVPPPVLLAATHARSLEWIDLADPQRAAVT